MTSATAAEDYAIEALLPQADSDEYLIWLRDTDILAAGEDWDEAVANFRKAWVKHGRDPGWLKGYLARHEDELRADAEAAHAREREWEARTAELNSSRMLFPVWLAQKAFQALTLGRRKPTGWYTEAERIEALFALRTKDQPGDMFADQRREMQMHGARVNQLLAYRAQQLAGFQREREDAIDERWHQSSKGLHEAIGGKNGDIRAAMRAQDEAWSAHYEDWKRRLEEAQALRHLKY